MLRAVELGERESGLTVGVRAVLVLLEAHGEQTVPQLGRAQSLSRQFVQRMVNDARAQGLVELRPNPAHRRSSLVRLTDAGSQAIAAATAREHALLRQVGGDLTAADLEACLHVLRQVLALFDDVDVDGGD